MIYIEPDINKSTVRYLYVKEFRWLDVFKTERFQGHLKPNSVYRSVYSDDTGHYKIVVTEEPTNVVLLDRLNNSNPDTLPFISEIVEISKHNILDLNLSEQDLDKLLTWMTPDKQVISGLQKLSNEMREQRQNEEAQDLAMGYELLAYLYNVDTTRFFTMLNVLEKVTDLTTSEEGDPAYHLTTDERFSTGLHIGSALRRLSIYTSDDKRESFDTEDLLASIYYLVRELETKTMSEK